MESCNHYPTLSTFMTTDRRNFHLYWLQR